MTGVEWADKYFRLPECSSQIAGQWTTQPLQVAMLNMMTSDQIKIFACKKSARLGYTKLLVCALFYLAEHKKRSAVVYQPVDDEANQFVVDEIDPTIADMPIMQNVFPSWSTRGENNNQNKKVMIGSIMDFRGATSPGNFRRLTKQVVAGDEINAWPMSVSKDGKGEGNPVKLALQRLKGASFPKAIFGTTPTVKGKSHISNILYDCDLTFRFFLPCPHCQHEQVLEFSDGISGRLDHGLMWDDEQDTVEKKAKTAFYRCISCAESFHYGDLYKMEIAGRWIAEEGTWTKDGLHFFDENNFRVQAPKAVGTEINAMYSLNLDGWGEIVNEWLRAKGKPEDERTFINTVLGQDFDEDTGEKLDHEMLMDRREIYPASVPERVQFITAGIDSQRNRYEMFVWGWGAGEEKWLIDKVICMGSYDKEETLQLVDRAIAKVYRKASGEELPISRICWDTGGIDPHIVYKRSKQHGIFRVIPIKGASAYGKQIADMPRKKNKEGVYLVLVGTDTAKDLLYLQMKVEPTSEAQHGAIHLPLDDEICDEVICQQLTSERLIEKNVNGKIAMRWDNEGRRNEALDCLVYALAALRISVNRFGLQLKEVDVVTPKPKRKFDISKIAGSFSE